MTDKWDDSLVKPLGQMSVGAIESFLSSYEFYSPEWYSEWSDKTYPESWCSGWFEVESNAGNGYDTPIGHVKLLDSFGGEGQGDDFWMVLQITQGDVVRTFKMNGYHVSHDGSYYDGPFVEVKPVQRTVTFWE